MTTEANGQPLRDFIQQHTAVRQPPIIPEVRLALADQVTPLWEAVERHTGQTGTSPPFWAFAWAGGQALARYILDNRDLIAGKRLIDVGSGGGLVAIAAAIAGAAQAVAVDIDPLAKPAARLNAELNDVDIEIVTGDATAIDSSAFQIIASGDVCYTRSEAAALSVWMHDAAAGGRTVLIGDPGRKFMPRDGVTEIARYSVPTEPDLESRESMLARVWRMHG